jgi:hypothetical protein
VLIMDIYNKMGLCEERAGNAADALVYFDFAINMTTGVHTSEETTHWNRSAAHRAHILGRTYTGADAYDTAAQSAYAANIYSNKANLYYVDAQFQTAMDQCDLSTSIRVDELDDAVHGAVGWNYFTKAKSDRALNVVNGVAAGTAGCDSDTKAMFTAAWDIYAAVLGPRHLHSMAVAKELATCP